MTSIKEIVHIDQLNPLTIHVHAILEDFVLLAPASPWSDYPAPAEYGPGHGTAMFIGSLDCLPTGKRELEDFIEELDLDWAPQ